MRSRRSHQHSWAQGVVDGSQADPPPRRAAGHHFPPPLTDAEMRAMYQRNRTPEVRALLWEIARLQRTVRRAAQFAACFPLYDSMMTSSACHIILGALRRELAEEPCLHADAPGGRDPVAEEIFDNVDTAIGRGARRRNR